MKREEIIRDALDLDAALATTLSQAELANGWTVKSQQAIQTLLREIVESLGARKSLPPLSIGRGLDHWGVEGGPLFEKACELSNHLREIDN